MTISELKIDESLLRQDIVQLGVTPHWKTSGREGRMSLRLLGNTKGKWLDLDTMEFAEKSSKRTMVVLHEDEVRALRDFCNMVLGE